MGINRLQAEEALRSAVSSASGLSEAEARRRLVTFGHNEIEQQRADPLWRRLPRQFTHFLAIVLWLAAALCFFSERHNPGEGMAKLGVAIIGVIVINAFFTFIQEYRAERALRALAKLLPYKVKVMRDGRETEADASLIVPGDIVLLSEGDKVPADGRIIECSGIRVNNATLTGESDAVALTEKPDSAEHPFESRNIVFAGASVLGGSCRAVVYATGMRTEIGRIARLTGAVHPGLSPLEQEIVKLTRIVAAIALGVGAAFFGIGFGMGRPFWENFIFAIGIFIALVPEGLLPTVTLSLAMGAQRMARRKALIRTLTSVETLGSVDVICTDKTGTLTENRMTVRQSVAFGPSAIPAHMIALWCNNARVVDGAVKGDPTETALYEYASRMGGDMAGERLREFPFDPDRKRMSVHVRTGDKEYLLVKGAPEAVFPLCARIDGHGGPMNFDSGMRDAASEKYHSLMDKGLRVLALAYRQVDRALLSEADAEQGLTLAGLVGLEDPPRAEVKEALIKCRMAGIRVIMITGDGTRTALAIGREIGLLSGEPRVIEGAELRAMNEARLRAALTSPEVIFTRMAPKHKLRVVEALKELGHRVAVTGDGVNDAPALRRADIGIAMGSGTDVAKEAADMVLLDDNFATIVGAIEEGRAVYENIRKFICYIFASNIPELVPYLAYVIVRIPLPLTIMQILAVDLGTDILPALGLGAEKPDKEIMRKPPRKLEERLLSAAMLTRAYLFLGPIEAAAGMAGYFYVLFSGGWGYGEQLQLTDPLYLQATTACLSAIIVTQVANAFACRSDTETAWELGFLSNRLLIWGICAELAIALLIVYSPSGNRFFGTHPIGLNVWAVLVPFGIALYMADMAAKRMARIKKSPAVAN